MSVNRRWNIFARKLEDILVERQLSWQDLYERVGIGQEYVEDLQASLLTPGAFPILTIEEMDDVIDVLDLTPDEVLQLRAAILAADVERMLMERIDDDAALQASEQVFATTLDSLRKLSGEKHSDVSLRGDSDPQKFFKDVKKLKEAGDIARHKSNRVAEDVRRRHLQDARYYFGQAIQMLERERTSDIGAMKTWESLYRTVQEAYNETMNAM
jgi:uncharacterized small protein (DUF1192 family)